MSRIREITFRRYHNTVSREILQDWGYCEESHTTLTQRMMRNALIDAGRIDVEKLPLDPVRPIEIDG